MSSGEPRLSHTKMTREPSREDYIRQILYHEAGHAVVGYALGLGCAGITVYKTTAPERDYVGGSAKLSQATVKGLMRQGQEDGIISYAICCQSGRAAQSRLCREQNLPFVPDGSTNDDDVLLWFTRTSGSDALTKFAWPAAQKTIEDRRIWSAICAVAFWFSPKVRFLAKETEHRVFMHGAIARAIMRRSGVDEKMKIVL